MTSEIPEHSSDKKKESEGVHLHDKGPKAQPEGTALSRTICIKSLAFS